MPRFIDNGSIRAERRRESATALIGDQGELLPAMRRFEIEGVSVEKSLPVVELTGMTARRRVSQGSARGPLTLPASVECAHCWYEESEDDRHVPQLVTTPAEVVDETPASGHAVGW